MPLKFRCPDCNAKIKVSSKFANQLGVCPTCRIRIKIPEESDPEFAEEMATSGAGEEASKAGSSVVATAEEKAESAKKPSPVPASSEEQEPPKRPAEPPADEKKESATAAAVEASKDSPAFIRFKCPNCDKSTGFPANMTGKAASCPLCKVRIMVPEESGGESFVVGSPRSASHRAASAAAPATATPDAPAPSSQPAQTPWGLVGVVGLVLFVAGLLTGLLIGGKGKETPAEQQAAAPSTPKASAQPTPPLPPTVQAPAPTKDRPAAKKEEPASPYLPPVVAPPKTETPDTKVEEGTPTTETPKAPEPKKETDPTSLIPTTLPRKQARKDDEEEPAVKDSSGTEVINELLPPDERKTAGTDPAKPTEPQTIAPVPKPPDCKRCMGVGYVPVPTLVPYVYMHGERPPNPQRMIPWLYCKECMKDRDNKELSALEAERFARSMENNKKWDTLLAPQKIKLVHVETRHVLLHCELPPTLAKQVGAMMDKLTTLLQKRSRSVMLTQTRPDTHEIVILSSNSSYNKLITLLEKASPGNDMSMMRDSSGFSMGKTAVFNAAGPGGGPPQPMAMAIHQFSKMLIGTACGGKAPPWLMQGFASHCENQLTRRNLCYTFSYELNDVQFGENWNQDIRKFALKGKLKKWEYIFPIDLIGLKALDYLTCYSMINFFMGDPTRFVKMVAEIRDGAESAAAIEKSYGRKIKDLQVMWANWAVQQR